MICPVSFHLNGKCELHSLLTEVSIVPPPLPDYHLPHRFIPTTPSTETKQACVSVNNTQLRGHLSAVLALSVGQRSMAELCQ